MIYDVIVIGAGAAGCMAAGVAAQNGKNVAVVDKNARIARKVMITGKGRCNVTNNCDERDFLLNVRTNPRFLYSALYNFSPRDTISFFEELGVELKTERGNRVFPVSDKAVDIVDALDKFLKQNNVSKIEGEVSAILTENGAVTGIKLQNGETINAQSVLIATGGKSYPLTGSNGDGYKLAKTLGHKIVPPQPSLIPIITKEDYPKEMQGLSLKNVTLTLKENGKVVFSELGEMLFTHFGVSGPLVLSASCHMDINKIENYTLSIDLKPGLDEEKLDTRILSDFSKYQNRDFFNSLGDLLPKKMIPVMVKLSGIDDKLKVNQITKSQRQQLVSLIKNFSLTPVAFRPIEEAIITSGGVCVNEIDPKTMQSKLVGGLFFAGEVIDVDAYTGGFNLQIAFSTGALAGKNM